MFLYVAKLAQYLRFNALSTFFRLMAPGFCIISTGSVDLFSTHLSLRYSSADCPDDALIADCERDPFLVFIGHGNIGSEHSISFDYRRRLVFLAPLALARGSCLVFQHCGE